ncbi:lipase family protein [Streptomyces sp. S6]
MAMGKPQLLFVHGIGGLRHTAGDRRRWLEALATGARDAEMADAISALTQGWLADARFADYSDLFNRRGAQGEAAEDFDEDEVPFLAELLDSMLNELAEQFPPENAPQDARVIRDARFQLDAAIEGRPSQGAGDLGRRLVGVTTTMLRLPGVRQTAQWMSGSAMLSQLAQVGRYLDRRAGKAQLGAAVRARVLDGLDPTRPLVVVSHSLGTVVAYEALHEYEGAVPLWVTLGSPLALGAVVLDRLVPDPPSCPPTVASWLNFWDRDDIVAGRPHLANWIGPSRSGVKAETRRVASRGLWTHTATKYLEHGAVARPVIEALQP